MFRSGTYTYDRSDENEIGLRCGVWVVSHQSGISTPPTPCPIAPSLCSLSFPLPTLSSRSVVKISRISGVYLGAAALHERETEFPDPV